MQLHEISAPKGSKKKKSLIPYLNLHLPQVGEAKTARSMDVTGQSLLYY